MADENKKPWWRNPAYLIIIATIAAAIISSPIWIPNNHPPDFRVSIDPMFGAFQAGGVIQTTVTVMGLHGYDHTVSLSASGQPSGIVIAFAPPFGEAKPSYTSSVTINVDPNVLAGDYPIIIKGTGADGKEHSCSYTLTVKPPVTPTTGTISVSSSPSSASIYLDGIYQGETPKTLENIEPGSCVITLKFEGYEEWSETIEVDAGGIINVSPLLEQIPTPPPTIKPQLSVSPSSYSYDFGTMSKGESKSKTFSISNAGGGILNWSVSSDKSWITVSPLSGINSGMVSITIKTADLSPGSYSGITTISSNGGTETINISLKILVFDFFAEAPNAKWDNGEEILPWEGDRSDPRGTVKNASNWLLEDGSKKEKVLFTHPKWEDNGFILGRYFLSEPIQSGDRFKAQVGFQSGSRGEVTFSVAYIESLEPVRLISLASVRDTGNDGQLRHIDVDLRDIAGKEEIEIILWVGAGSSSYQDWAVWAYPRIER